MYTFERLATLHALASEEMPDSKKVKEIESIAIEQGISVAELRKKSLAIEHA